LDHRITIQRLTVGANEFNEPVDVWSDVATLYARKAEASGNEAVRSDEITGQLIVTFRVRSSSIAAAITARDRVMFENRFFNIVGIKRIGFRWFDIDVVEHVGLIHNNYIVTVNGDRIVTINGEPLVTAW